MGQREGNRLTAGSRNRSQCALTPLLEGDIVRHISRLDEVCKEVRSAARILGDAPLFKKLENVSAAIKRDIVFAASLYTT